MGEELAEHEGVVGLGVVLGQVDVLVHVEGDDVLEGELAGLDELDEVLVGRDGGRARGQAEHERLLGRRREVLYPVCARASCMRERWRALCVRTGATVSLAESIRRV